MSVTIMIIMGLLSALAVSSIDFDELEQIRERINDAREDAETEDEVQDTNDLGWLDVDTDRESIEPLDTDLLSFLGNDIALGASETSLTPTLANSSEPEDADVFNSFGVEENDRAEVFSFDAANDLWPLEAQSQSNDPEEDEEMTEEEDATNDMIEIAGFNAEEDALELPYQQKQDEAGNVIEPTISVSHHDGWTEVGVNDETHSFAHISGTNFKGLEPEDVLLRAA